MAKYRLLLLAEQGLFLLMTHGLQVFVNLFLYFKYTVPFIIKYAKIKSVHTRLYGMKYMLILPRLVFFQVNVPYL